MIQLAEISILDPEAAAIPLKSGFTRMATLSNGRSWVVANKLPNRGYHSRAMASVESAQAFKAGALEVSIRTVAAWAVTRVHAPTIDVCQRVRRIAIQPARFMRYG